MNRILRRVVIELCVFVFIILIPVWVIPYWIYFAFFWKPDPHLLRLSKYVAQTATDEARDDAVIHMLEMWRARGERPAERIQHLERLLAFRAHPVLP